MRDYRRREQDLRDSNPAEHSDIAFLLGEVDRQRKVNKAEQSKIDRQKAQLRTGWGNAAARKQTITEQDRLIAEQADEIQALRDEIARLRESQEDNH